MKANSNSSLVTLEPFQARISKELISKIQEDPYNALLLEGKTGVGKTFMLGEVARFLLNSDVRFKEFNQGFPIIYLTKASVVQQTREVLFSLFKLPLDKIYVCNYDQLRSQLGSLWIEWKKILLNGELVEVPFWNKSFMPLSIFADECQALKNPGTLQTSIMRAYVIQGGLVVASSATPFTRLSEAEFLTLGIRPRVLGWGVINEKTWPVWSRELAGVTHDPTKFNAEAVKRLMVHLEHRVVHVKGVRFPVKSHNHCKLVEFECYEDKVEYLEYYTRWLEELEKIDRYAPEGPIAVLVATNKFREAAELIKSKYLADVGIDNAKKHNKQIIIAFNFKKSLDKCYKRLLEKGVKAEDISVIVGGQTSKIREKNKNNFQLGRTTYLLMTLKSGGVGLSLDHNRTNEFVAKARYVILGIPWSAVELVQVIGRAIRLFSVSDVYQDIVGFLGTVEEEVLAKLELKFACLAEIVGKKESWVGLFAKKHELDSISDLNELMKNEVVESDEYGEEEEFDEAILA